MRDLYRVALVGLGLSVLVVNHASATVCQTETPPGTVAPVYTCQNGTTSFPGTFVGTVGTATGDVIQIGSLALYNGGSGGAFVNANHNPSIYSFDWSGGQISITEQIGNNGTGDPIQVQLFSLPSMSSSSPTLPALASITIPFSSGPSATFTLDSVVLGAGYYAIETSLSTVSVEDPNYQINFAVPTPEPSTLAILGTALGVAGLVGRRRRATATL
jgi:hypothetical protein